MFSYLQADNKVEFVIKRKPLGLNKSNIKSRDDIKNWDEFKQYAFSREADGKIFRGQSSDWKLKTSFHRTNRTDLWKYMVKDIPQLAIHFSSNTNFLYEVTNSTHLAAILSTAQHHGYPTPLLDWTLSPFIAAYFAFCNIQEEDFREQDNKESSIRIFIFNIQEWQNELPQFSDLKIRNPHFSITQLQSFNNPRFLAQQSVLSLCNMVDIEEYLLYQNTNFGIDFIEAIDLPKSQYREILRDLEKIGVSYGALFPGLDGVCGTLKQKNFEY
nr:FRG domain-containing protein [Pseudaquidulcibacter saccharophilus]